MSHCAPKSVNRKTCIRRESQTNPIGDSRVDARTIDRDGDVLEAIRARVSRSELVGVQSHNLSFIVNKSTGEDQVTYMVSGSVPFPTSTSDEG